MNDDAEDIGSGDTFPQTTVWVTGNTISGGSATVLVWNDAGTARRIRVGIANRNTGTLFLQRSYRIEADAFIELKVTKPGAYSLDVGPDGDEPASTDFSVDTCNSARVTAAVRPSGAVDWDQLATTAGCIATTKTE